MVDHWINIEDRHSFKFGVKACGHAVLKLRHSLNVLPHDDVIVNINEGYVSILLYDPENVEWPLYNYTRYSTLSCNSYKYFWFSWFGSTLLEFWC